MSLASARPDPSRVRHPSRVLLYPLRPAGRSILRRRIPVRLHRPERVPGRGPVIYAANHIGLMDGPLLAIFSPRPAHALTKSEMFAGRLGGFLRATGQIKVERGQVDVGAMRTCLRVLEADRCVGVFPESTRGDGRMRRIHPGAAYLAMVTGAPVVPVTFFGSRAPGAGSHALPPRGGTVDMVYGDLWRTPAVPWPRRRADVAARTGDLHLHLRAAVADAEQLTGLDLPGPMPIEEEAS